MSNECLERVVIPNTIKTIEDYSFAGCERLEGIDILSNNINLAYNTMLNGCG